MVTNVPGRKPPKPLDKDRLEELALAYVARFAMSAAKLDGYLRRKLRERGWEGEGRAAGPDSTLVARFVAAGYVDDAAFRARRRAAACCAAAMASGGSTRRWARRASARTIRGEVRAGAARRSARPRWRWRASAASGPFGGGPPDRARREKQIAAMLRAGHPLDSARELVDAASVAAAEHWAETDEMRLKPALVALALALSPDRRRRLLAAAGAAGAVAGQCRAGRCIRSPACR